MCLHFNKYHTRYTMKLALLKHSKRILVGVALAIGCLGMASVTFAEAKAIEFSHILRACYTHTMRNEFLIRSANMYKAPINSWGEIISREESGMDGSVTKTWLIGEVKDGPHNDVIFHIQSQVVQKLDNSGKTVSWKYDDVNYALLIYPQSEFSFKVVKPKGAKLPSIDIEGDYISSVEYPMMSNEAAMYVLQRFMNGNPVYRNKLQGAALQHIGNDLDEKHTFKLVEHHQDHVVTRGTYKVNADGSIFEYDIVMDKWKKITQ